MRRSLAEHNHHPEREEHHQVYGDVAKPDHDDRPRVRRQQPELGGHVAAIRPEVINRLGLLVHDRPSDGFRCRGIIVAGRGVEEIAIGLALRTLLGTSCRSTLRTSPSRLSHEASQPPA